MKQSKNILLPILVWTIFILGWGIIVSYVKNIYGDNGAIIFTFKSLFFVLCIFLSIFIFVIIVVVVEIKAHKKKYFSFIEDYSDFMKKYFPKLTYEEFYELGTVREELYHKKEHLPSAIMMDRLKKTSKDINFCANSEERKRAEELIQFFTTTKAITVYGKILEKGKNVFNILLFRNYIK